MIFNAIFPIFLLIVIGYTLKFCKITDKAFWEKTEHLIYYFFLPSLLISKLSSTELTGINIGSIAFASLLSMAILVLLCLITSKYLKLDPASFGSVFQGSIRFNTYIGLAIVSALFDSKSLTILIIIASFNIPIVNVLSISVLQSQSSAGKVSNSAAFRLVELSKQILKNPLILACLTGIGLNLLNIPLPIFLFETLNILGTIALPLGLMTVGSALQLQQITSSYKPIMSSCILKLLVYPIIAYTVASIVQLDQQTTITLVIFSALPTASSSYILAKSLRSDYQLMARIITIETLLSAVTLLVILKVLNIS